MVLCVCWCLMVTQTTSNYHTHACTTLSQMPATSHQPCPILASAWRPQPLSPVLTHPSNPMPCLLCRSPPCPALPCPATPCPVLSHRALRFALPAPHLPCPSVPFSTTWPRPRLHPAPDSPQGLGEGGGVVAWLPVVGGHGLCEAFPGVPPDLGLERLTRQGAPPRVRAKPRVRSRQQDAENARFSS